MAHTTGRMLMPDDPDYPKEGDGNNILILTDDGEVVTDFTVIDHRQMSDGGVVADALNTALQEAKVPGLEIDNIDCGDDHVYLGIMKAQLPWEVADLDIRTLPVKFQNHILNRLTDKDADELTSEEREELIKRHKLDKTTPFHVMEEILHWEGIIGYGGFMMEMFESIFRFPS